MKLTKVDSVRSILFGALRPYYQKRDRLRLVIQYRKGDPKAHGFEVAFKAKDPLQSRPLHQNRRKPGSQ